VGVAFGIYLRKLSMGDLNVSCYAGVSAFLAQSLSWYFLIERQRKLGVRRAICAGVFGAALSHYVCWYLQILSLNVDYWVFWNQTGEPPANPIQGLWIAFGWSLVSLLYIGFRSWLWLALPVGGYLGLVFGAFIEKHLENELEVNHGAE